MPKFPPPCYPCSVLVATYACPVAGLLAAGAFISPYRIGCIPPPGIVVELTGGQQPRRLRYAPAFLLTEGWMPSPNSGSEGERVSEQRANCDDRALGAMAWVLPIMA
jgi:hypothetical protein